ncbi:MAG: OmpH family outer membrane protein [Bacteroidia bacterium]
MWNKQAIGVIAIVLAVGAIGLVIHEKMSSPKIGFVRIKEVFEKFEMKKEMELKFDHENGYRQRALDSIAFVLQNEAQTLESMERPSDSLINYFTVRKNNYLGRKEQFDNDKQSQTSNYNSQIILRMSQYVKEYGEGNGYSYILGDDGNGSVMFAKDAQDLTAPVIVYINEKYSGQKK